MFHPKDILPISLRVQVFFSDAKLSGAPKPMSMEAITAPTCVALFEDHRLGTAA